MCSLEKPWLASLGSVEQIGLSDFPASQGIPRLGSEADHSTQPTACKKSYDVKAVIRMWVYPIYLEIGNPYWISRGAVTTDEVRFWRNKQWVKGTFIMCEVSNLRTPNPFARH